MRIALKLKHAVQAFLPVALLVTFTGCQTVPDEDAENQQPKPLPFSKLTVPKAELIDDSPLEVEEMEKKETTEIKREDVPSRAQTARDTSAASSDYPDNLIKGTSSMSTCSSTRAPSTKSSPPSPMKIF